MYDLFTLEVCPDWYRSAPTPKAAFYNVSQQETLALRVTAQ